MSIHLECTSAMDCYLSGSYTGAVTSHEIVAERDTEKINGSLCIY